MNAEQTKHLREKFFEYIENLNTSEEYIWNWIETHCLPIQEQSDAIEYFEWRITPRIYGGCTFENGKTIWKTEQQLYQEFKSKTK